MRYVALLPRSVRELYCNPTHMLTAIGLTPGGSCTVHIYTQTIHRTTQLTTTQQQNNTINKNNTSNNNTISNITQLTLRERFQRNRGCLWEMTKTCRARATDVWRKAVVWYLTGSNWRSGTLLLIVTCFEMLSCVIAQPLHVVSML